MSTNPSPIHVLSLGAGVQSSTLAFMAAKGEITPMPDTAIFADTGDEPASVYRWLDWLEAQLPFQVTRLSHKEPLSVVTLKLRARRDGKGFYIHSGVPHYSINADGSKGHGPRQCTHGFKIAPILKEIRRLIKPRMTDWRRKHRAEVVAWTAYTKALDAFKKAHKSGQAASPQRFPKRLGTPCRPTPWRCSTSASARTRRSA